MTLSLQRNACDVASSVIVEVVEPVHAILNPPELRQFRELVGVGDADLEVSFEGWSKLAILTDDRVFLFPRRGRECPLVYGARMARAVRAQDVAVAPPLVEIWDDPSLSFGPFVEFERVPGTPWISIERDASLDELERVLQSLGAAIATWHNIAVGDLSEALQDAPGFGAKPHLDPLLRPGVVGEALHAIAGAAGLPAATASVWTRATLPVAEMDHVVVHGDVCENQLFVDGNRDVTTVIDWDTATVAHPLHDFDFGEWGFIIFDQEAEFARLRESMWNAYIGARGIEGPSAAAVHLLFTVAELGYFAARRDALDDWGQARLRNLLAAVGPATDAAC